MNVICDTVIFIGDYTTATWMQALQERYNRTTFQHGMTPEGVFSEVSALGPDSVLLIHGPSLWHSFFRITACPVLWCFTSPPPIGQLPTTWSTLELSHAACGGILAGSWVCACNAFGSLPATVPPFNLARRIRHIIQPATPGQFRAVPAPLDSDDRMFARPWFVSGVQHKLVLNWNGLLPYDRPFLHVLCRSEFSPTRWTCRGLSSKELCQAFDIPVSFSSLFSDISAGLRHTLPFLRVAPTKVTKRFWDLTTLTIILRGGEPEGPKLNLPDSLWRDGTETETSMTNTATLPDTAATGARPTSTTASLIQNEVDSPALRNTEVGNFEKATKSDDAAIPVEIWDDRIWALGLHTEERVSQFTAKWTARREASAAKLAERLRSKTFTRSYKDRWCEGPSQNRSPLTVLREAVCARWKRNVQRSLIAYLHTRFGPSWKQDPKAQLDVAAGRDCVERMADADFWAWRRGSRCFFWRWHPEFVQSIRDGFPIWVQGPLPQNKKPQRCEKNQEVCQQMADKIQKVRELGYILAGFVASLTNYFAVPKGDRDIRMVYDATKSRLNHALWVPSFALPTVDSMMRQVETTTWMADLDLGDMFLNFMLDAKLRASCGVDLKPLFPEEAGEGTLWERWERCLMGLKPSPYICIKAQHLGTEVLRGDRSDQKNAYRWDLIVLNLPGSKLYDPQEPWLKRIRKDSGKIAGNTVTYVDDLRSLGESRDECWSVAHQTGSRLGYLGIQNAPRKTRPPSQQPGAWAGTVAEASSMGVGVRSSQEKWDKAKRLLNEIQAELDTGQALMHKPLEQKRGFFIHLQRTYPNMTPFIKGIHLTLDGWRPGRDSELWKCKHESEGYWDEKEGIWLPADLGSLKPPATVKPAPRLRDDVNALQQLLKPTTPPVRLLRSRSISVAVYGFVDASGVGFGSAIQTSNGLHYRYGLWGRDADSTSSNYKELRNLVEAVEEGVQSGMLTGTELFIFTDNSTAEGAFYKGNTDSRLLFELVLRLRVLDMKASLILHVIHVAGTRMIAQGVDGLSRGDLTEGVMAGRNILEFIPLHEDAISRAPALKTWFRQWLPEKPSPVWLDVEGWFEEGHGTRGGFRDRHGMWFPHETGERWFVWAPPPAIADIALEELSVSRHKRSHLNHVFVCPRLMTQRWRKMLHRLADAVIEIPAGARPFWPKEMHEPLIVGLTLRFASQPPWQLRRADRVLDIQGELRGLWKNETGSELDLLRELCALPDVLDAV